ncbi:MAG: type II secretion system F family protein [Pseudolabrys sp.]|nr:type II secretion system F family protein [Pseudolabrys sp.]
MSAFATLFGFADPASAMAGLMIFLAAGTMAFALMMFLRSRSAVKRRASRINEEPAANSKRALRHSSRRIAHRLLEATTRHYASANSDNLKVLRRRLVQAGIYDPRAVAAFFLIRTALAVALGGAVFFVMPHVYPLGSSMLYLVMIAAGIAGYIAPSLYLDKRIGRRKDEHRAGFPDFMDLLVVCADAGLSIEAAFERIARELGDSYPSLTSNIHMTNLEIRAGRALSDALEHFSDRLALEEARSFSTLVNQSLELGSSITDALRVYSDDMRHKRLSRAEEKAYALPAKLALPMMVCIFPVLFVVILLPVAVKLATGNFSH